MDCIREHHLLLVIHVPKLLEKCVGSWIVFSNLLPMKGIPLVELFGFFGWVGTVTSLSFSLFRWCAP